jgi:hypothetical protein
MCIPNHTVTDCFCQEAKRILSTSVIPFKISESKKTLKIFANDYNQLMKLTAIPSLRTHVTEHRAMKTHLRV